KKRLGVDADVRHSQVRRAGDLPAPADRDGVRVHPAVRPDGRAVLRDAAGDPTGRGRRRSGPAAGTRTAEPRVRESAPADGRGHPGRTDRTAVPTPAHRPPDPPAATVGEGPGTVAGPGLAPRITVRGVVLSVL